MTDKKYGQAGGNAVVEKYGKEHMRKIGRRGGNAVVEKYGKEHMAKIGKVGFAVYVERHWDGNRRAAIADLIAKGLAAQDPFPANGAWQGFRMTGAEADES